MISLNDLHDVTLTRIQFVWKEGELLVEFKTGIGDSSLVVLAAEGVSNLLCPRRFPWGRSVSVNAVTEESVPDGDMLLGIQMQSGDAIEVICRAWSLK
jgi:hypothetical protein